MRVLIEYAAKLTWVDEEGNGHHREWCLVVHEIDKQTLKTTNFQFKPFSEEGEKDVTSRQNKKESGDGGKNSCEISKGKGSGGG